MRHTHLVCNVEDPCKILGVFKLKRVKLHPQRLGRHVCFPCSIIYSRTTDGLQQSHLRERGLLEYLELFSVQLCRKLCYSCDVTVAKLATSPSSTGAPAEGKTIGIVLVAFIAARIEPVDRVTITSTLEPTNSAANSANRSIFPSAYRYSKMMFFPST